MGRNPLMDFEELWWGFEFEDEDYEKYRRSEEKMVIRGKAYWASVLAPNTTFTPCWTVDLLVDDDTAVTLKDMGLKAKNTEDGPVFKFKRNVQRADGMGENRPPRVVDVDGSTPFDKLIGNGSDVYVQFKTYEWKNKFGKGVGADLQAVQVISHIPYEKADGEEFEDLSGKETEKPKNREFDDDLPDVI